MGRTQEPVDGRVGGGDLSPGRGCPAKTGLSSSQRRRDRPRSSGPAHRTKHQRSGTHLPSQPRRLSVKRAHRDAGQSLVALPAVPRLLTVNCPIERAYAKDGAESHGAAYQGAGRACRGRGRASVVCPCMLGVGGVAVLLGRGHVVRRLSCWWRARSHRWGVAEGVATRLYLPWLLGVGSWWLCCWGAAWRAAGGSSCSRRSDDIPARRKRKRFPGLRGW